MEQFHGVDPSGCGEPSTTRRRRTTRVTPSAIVASRSATRCGLVEAECVPVHAAADEHVEQVQAVLVTVRDQVLVGQLHGSLTLHHGIGRPAYGADPVGQFRDVAHRCRQRDQANVMRQVNDHLLPDRPAIGVLQEVHLVDHDRSEVAQVAAGVDHVPQHLGRHDDDRRVAVDRVVTGQEPHGIVAMDLDEVAVLLVRKRLDRRGVERAPAVDAVRRDAVLRDDRLSAPRRRSDHDVAPGIERVEGLGLEPIGGERERRDQVAAVRTDGHRWLRPRREPVGVRRCSRSTRRGSTGQSSGWRASPM